jgi:hypothetical protein
MKYKIKSDLVWEEINDGMVILDPNQGKSFSLNKTAGEIWLNFKGIKTEEQIKKLIFQKYGENKEKIELDVKKCLVDLLEMGILIKIEE